MSEKPGVMIYFEVAEVLKRLTDAQSGKLFRAILEYAATKREPILSDDLYAIWPLIRDALDTDDERHYKVSQKKRYAAYVRWTKQRNEEPLSLDQWLFDFDTVLTTMKLSLPELHMHSSALRTMPTTTTTTTTATTTETTTETTTKTTTRTSITTST